MVTTTHHPAPLPQEHQTLLLEVTGRADLVDALDWIGEQRPIRGGVTNRVLTALVAAADGRWPSADAALRVAAKLALRSTLDTSADLLCTDSIVPPSRYQQALAAVASRTSTGTLSGINAQAVGAGQAHDPLVVETLALVAGLSWRDLRDRSQTRGTALPSEPKSPWKASQILSAFTIIDEIITGKVEPQLAGAVGARPLELLLSHTSSWDDVEALRVGGVSYGTLLAQRDVGSAWSAHRNRTNNEVSRLVVQNVLAALQEAGVNYWSTEGDGHVPRSFLAGKAVTSGQVPGQLSVVTRGPCGSAAYAVFIAVARDGGTARKTAATFLKLPEVLALPAALVLVGTGWADRGETDTLVRAFNGRVYTEHTLAALAAMAATPSDANDTMG